MYGSACRPAVVELLFVPVGRQSRGKINRGLSRLRTTRIGMSTVLQAADPVPFPELGKADTRSAKGTGSAACKSAPERPQSTSTIAGDSASLPSIPLARRMQRRQMPPQRDAAWLEDPCLQVDRELTAILRDDCGLLTAVVVGSVTETCWLLPQVPVESSPGERLPAGRRRRGHQHESVTEPDC